jgi:ubiquinone/menaquinone biosynthesis C-methylase UbiE
MRRDNYNLSQEDIKDRIKRVWDGIGGDYDKFHCHGAEDAWRMFFTEELGDEKLRVLDVGVGTGFLSLPLAELGHDVVGVDLSEGMLSAARKKAKERGLNLDLRIGDAEALDLEDECFDAVISRWVLWTLPNPEKAVREWRRVVNPGGKVYAFTTNFSGIDEGLSRGIKRNFGMFMISVIERRNGWAKGNRYDRDMEEKLPLHYKKPTSRINNKVKLFAKCGLENVTATKIEVVSELLKKKREERQLRYKLAWGSSNTAHEFYCISGRKPKGMEGDVSR